MKTARTTDGSKTVKVLGYHDPDWPGLWGLADLSMKPISQGSTYSLYSCKAAAVPKKKRKKKKKTSRLYLKMPDGWREKRRLARDSFLRGFDMASKHTNVKSAQAGQLYTIIRDRVLVRILS